MKKPVVITAITVLLAAGAVAEEKTLPRSHSPEEGETHFGELLMLTDDGENAEAYFSFDGKSLILQSTKVEWV